MSKPEVNNRRESLIAIGVCAVAILGIMVLMATPRGASPGWLSTRMLAVHTLLELFAILISGLVVASAWHTLDRDKESNAQVFVVGFVVVMVCDVLHVADLQGDADLHQPELDPTGHLLLAHGAQRGVVGAGSDHVLRRAALVKVGIARHGAGDRRAASSSLGHSSWTLSRPRSSRAGVSPP